MNKVSELIIQAKIIIEEIQKLLNKKNVKKQDVSNKSISELCNKGKEIIDETSRLIKQKER